MNLTIKADITENVLHSPTSFMSLCISKGPFIKPHYVPWLLSSLPWEMNHVNNSRLEGCSTLPCLLGLRLPHLYTKVLTTALSTSLFPRIKKREIPLEIENRVHIHKNVQNLNFRSVKASIQSHLTTGVALHRQTPLWPRRGNSSCKQLASPKLLLSTSFGWKSQVY